MSALDSLTVDEKRSLLILLMEDIRGAFDLGAGERTQTVIGLADELGYEQVHKHAQAYVDDDGYRDGRHFRRDFTDGGYDNPPFPVIRTTAEASPALRAAVDALCEYPESRLVYEA